MKIYDGPDGRKYVENAKAGTDWYPVGTVFWSDACQLVLVNKVVSKIMDGGIILRLATPEEIAGTEKKMCPAGCGADYGAHASHQGCPWFKALLKKSDLDSTADFPLCSAYADAHWKEWDEKAEAGVTPEGAATPNACTAKKAASAPPAQPEILPTCPCCKGADGFRLDVVDGHLTAIPVFNSKPGDALRVCPECWKPDANAPQGVEPDAPDRRTEHVPVAKAWVNPAMLGR